MYFTADNFVFIAPHGMLEPNNADPLETQARIVRFNAASGIYEEQYKTLMYNDGGDIESGVRGQSAAIAYQDGGTLATSTMYIGGALDKRGLSNGSEDSSLLKMGLSVTKVSPADLSI